jgi:hypothetical protein
MGAGYFRGVKRPGPEGNLSTTSSAEVENEWRYTSDVSSWCGEGSYHICGRYSIRIPRAVTVVVAHKKPKVVKWLVVLTFICPCIASISLKCNQQDATFSRSQRSLDLFISINCSTCFRRFLRPSSSVPSHPR